LANLCCGSAGVIQQLTALITRLNRWAFDIAIRAIHAAIAWRRLEDSAAILAVVKELACICGHQIFGFMATFRAGQRRIGFIFVRSHIQLISIPVSEISITWFPCGQIDGAMGQLQSFITLIPDRLHSATSVQELEQHADRFKPEYVLKQRPPLVLIGSALLNTAYSRQRTRKEQH
jgi:hypothetical protein